MVKKLNIKFQIKGVEVVDMELRQPREVLPPQINFNFNLSIEHKVSSEQKLLLVMVGIRVYNKEDQKNLMGRILVSCVYAIENFDEIVKKTGPGKYDVTDEITDLLNSISISTTRGVMATMFKGTSLHGAILPVIYPKSLSKKRPPSKKSNVSGKGDKKG